MGHKKVAKKGEGRGDRTSVELEAVDAGLLLQLAQAVHEPGHRLGIGDVKGDNGGAVPPVEEARLERLPPAALRHLALYEKVVLRALPVPARPSARVGGWREGDRGGRMREGLLRDGIRRRWQLARNVRVPYKPPI